MSLKERRLGLIQAAADRLGLTLNPDIVLLPCFDETYLFGPWPDRTDGLISGDLPENTADRMRLFQKSKLWVVEHQSRTGLDEVAEAVACGCRVGVHTPFHNVTLD